jgi:hypothetical protein
MSQSLRFYKRGFFVSLSLIFLLLAALIPPLIKGQSPKRFYRDLFYSTEDEGSDPRVIPTSFFTSLELVKSITPASQTREALREADNTVTITFSQPMETSCENSLINYSVYTENEPLDFRNYSWRNQQEFVLRLDRSLKEGESLLLDFRFITADTKQQQIVRVRYE